MLTDAQWLAFKTALDAVRSARRRPMKHERQTFEAVLWRLRNGARWRALPAELGPWHRAANLHGRWSRMGLWQRLFEYLRDAGHPDLADVMFDGSSIRAHHKAAGAKGTEGTRRDGP